MNHNLLINLFSFCMAAIMLVSDRSFDGAAPIQKRFRKILLCISLVLILDSAAWQLDGVIYPNSRTVLFLLNTVFFFVEIVYCLLWVFYVDYWTFESRTHIRERQFIYGIPAVLQVGLLIVNGFTGWFFRIDADCRYVRGDFFVFYLVTYISYIVLVFLVDLSGFRRQTSHGRKKQILCMMFFVLFPVLGVTLQYLFYGYSLIAPFITLSLLMTYLNIQQRQLHERNIRLEQHKNEELQQKVELMLSRIQPHFLFNALNVIAYQCETGSGDAGSTVENFACYLRGNLSSIKLCEPIPFDAELEHLRSYIYIEKLRFPDIRFETDFKATEFSIPVLTVQPLVEIAVRYGATQKAGGGGTVLISTWEDAESFFLSVSDNGVGFDPETVQYDGHSGVGIADTRERIAAQCHGTMQITRAANIGTIVTVAIPKSMN